MENYQDGIQQELTWAEKFRIVRKKLNWPARHMMEYIDAGYIVYSYYNKIENGFDVPSDYLVRELCRAFYINIEWMYSGQGVMLTNESRIRSSTEEIERRAQRKRVSRSLHGLQELANNMQVGLEWLVCGDVRAKLFPCDDNMIQFLRKNESIRKYIWRIMEEDTNELFYSTIKKLRLENKNDDEKHRINELRLVLGLTVKEYGKETEVSIEHIKIPTEIARNKIAEFCSVSREYLRTGDIESMAWPCEQKMIGFLKSNPDLRKQIVEEMNKCKIGY